MNINIDCGITNENYLSYNQTKHLRPVDKHLGENIDLGLYTCGVEEPEDRDDCTDYSDLTNSCCIFSTEEQFSDKNKNGCYSIEQKYSGSYKVQSFKYGDEEKTIYYRCPVNFISLNLVLLLVLFFVLAR